MALQPIGPLSVFFFSFSILYTVGRIPWTGYQPDTNMYIIYTTNVYIYHKYIIIIVLLFILKVLTSHFQHSHYICHLCYLSK
jgi:hypothetical protein